ncbi:MAG TPA: DUF6776 family protein [Steroidobacteraceae bacterium]|nr:DUF6776 family protein [Steroidobacteraceae bacterium]
MKVPTVSVPRLVVRTNEPGRRRFVVLSMLLVVAVLLWIAFEWGRGNLGLPGGITPDRVTLRERVGSLEGEVRNLRVELARRESERVGQARERTELAGTIGSLRGDVQRLESELGFYRGVLGAGAQPDTLRIQQFRVSGGGEANTYRLRLVLGRTFNPEGAVSGKLRITFEAEPGSGPVSVDLAQVAGIEGGELPFDFRYLEELEQMIRLPAGFTPVRVVVELAPARKGVNPVRETFPWTVEN